MDSQLQIALGENRNSLRAVYRYHKARQPNAGYQEALKPTVQIMKSISFQKFRQDGENRPGIKNQRNQFMTLELSNMGGKTVHVFILCVNAEDMEQIHPNGLVGKNCHHGIYDQLYTINSSKEPCQLEIPYLHIVRMKTRKSNIEKNNERLVTRTRFLPSPWRERFMSQCDETLWTNKIDTTKVRLAVIVTVESSPGRLDKPLIAVSDITKNGSQNTSLGIAKLSTTSVPARTGTNIDIFTKESSPHIEPGKYKVYITHEPRGRKQKLEHWISAELMLSERSIWYKKVITYKVPPFEPDPHLTMAVEATLHLECSESRLHCTFPFFYVPSEDTMNVVGHNDYEILTDTDLDTSPSSKKLRLSLFEDDDITASFKGSVKIKPAQCQGDASGYMTEGRDTQNAHNGKQYITDLNAQNSQYSQMTAREISEKMKIKMDDAFSDIISDGVIKNSSWFAPIVDKDSQQDFLKLENKNVDCNRSQSHQVCNEQNKSLTLSNFPVSLSDQLATASLDQPAAVFSLKRKLPQHTHFQPMTPNYQEPVFAAMSMSIPNIFQNEHADESSNAEVDVISGVKLEQWDNQIFCHEERIESCSALDQNTFSQISMGQSLNNCQANSAIKESNISETEHIPASGSADTFNLTSFDQFDIDVFLRELISNDCFMDFNC